MVQNSYIKLVDKSKKSSITVEEIEELIQYYLQITKKTGEQLNFPYEAFAWPYDILKKDTAEGRVLFLKANQQKYSSFALGVASEQNNVIQISLNDNSTEADKGKANELAKFIAKKLEGQLHLFNGRVMYFYKR